MSSPFESIYRILTRDLCVKIQYVLPTDRMNRGDTMSCAPSGCEPRWENHHDHGRDRDCNKQPRKVTKRMSVLPYVRVQNNVYAALYSYIFNGSSPAPVITSVPNTNPNLAYIRFPESDGALFGFGLHQPKLGDSVLIANLAGTAPPYTNFLPAAVTNALYSIDTLPSSLFPWYILKPYNVTADLCNGWRVNDLIFAQYNASGSRSYDIVQIGSTGTPAVPGQVYVSYASVGSFVNFGNICRQHCDYDDDCDSSSSCSDSSYSCSSSYDSFSLSSFYSSSDDCEDRNQKPSPIRAYSGRPTPLIPGAPLLFTDDGFSLNSISESSVGRKRRNDGRSYAKSKRVDNGVVGSVRGRAETKSYKGKTRR